MTTTSWIDYEIQESQPPAGLQIIDHPPHGEGVNGCSANLGSGRRVVTRMLAMALIGLTRKAEAGWESYGCESKQCISGEQAAVGFDRDGRALISLLLASLDYLARSARSKNAITRRSYSRGRVSMPPVCEAPATSQSCLGSPAAA